MYDFKGVIRMSDFKPVDTVFDPAYKGVSGNIYNTHSEEDRRPEFHQVRSTYDHVPHSHSQSHNYNSGIIATVLAVGSFIVIGSYNLISMINTW